MQQVTEWRKFSFHSTMKYILFTMKLFFWCNRASYAQTTLFKNLFFFRRTCFSGIFFIRHHGMSLTVYLTSVNDNKFYVEPAKNWRRPSWKRIWVWLPVDKLVRCHKSSSVPRRQEAPLPEDTGRFGWSENTRFTRWKKHSSRGFKLRLEKTKPVKSEHSS